MAVSKKQLAEWSKAFEEKYSEESKKSTYTVPEQKKEKVSKLFCDFYEKKRASGVTIDETDFMLRRF